jgi:4-hydroxy-tetrahydrodipicolinate synthase
MRGVFTALITPFSAQNEIDFDAYRRILHDQRDAKITGVIPCGTTGESPTLHIDEKKKLIQFTLRELKGSGLKVLAGTGSNNTAETIEFSRWASDQGVDGVLVVTPYYNKPSASGLEAHFRAVADAVQCELMLYNVPGRTSISLTPATIAQLASHPRIRSVKEATGNVEFTSKISDAFKQAGQSMDILSGDDATFLPLLSIGAVGAVSVASNLFPRAMVGILNAIEKGKLAEGRLLHQQYYPLFRDLFVEANPVPIKYAMARMGWCDARVRAPLSPLMDESIQKLEAAMSICGVSKGKAL